MRYDLFEAMSVDEASNVLDEFVHRGPEILKTEQIKYDKVSLSELPEELLKIGLRLTTIPLASDPSVPEFVRNTDD